MFLSSLPSIKSKKPHGASSPPVVGSMWITLVNIVVMATALSSFLGFLRELGRTVIFNKGLEGDLSSPEERLDGVLLADIVVTLCTFTSVITIETLSYHHKECDLEKSELFV